MHNLAWCLWRSGRLEEAFEQETKVLERAKTTNAVAMEYTLLYMRTLAGILLSLGCWESAYEKASEAVNDHVKTHGPKDERTICCKVVLSMAARKANVVDQDAEKVLTEVLHDYGEVLLSLGVSNTIALDKTLCSTALAETLRKHGFDNAAYELEPEAYEASSRSDESSLRYRAGPFERLLAQKQRLDGFS